MNWLLLITAGLFEVVSSTTLKHSESFSFTSFLSTIFAMSIGFYLIGIALRSLPLGAACAVWVGTAVTGTILFDETTIPVILIFVILASTGIIKSNLISISHPFLQSATAIRHNLIQMLVSIWPSICRKR